MPKKCIYNELQALRDVQSLKRTRVSPKQNPRNTCNVGTRLLAEFQFTECLCRATLPVNIHVVIVKEVEIQPGDNSQSISAIFLGLHLKALSQIAEMIHCT